MPDKFCSHCGQANTEPKESFFHLVADFFSDITHYDSKVFVTLKDLIFKPGFLTKEYNAGRRVTYLNPVRLYVFISAVFFSSFLQAKKKMKKMKKMMTRQQIFFVRNLQIACASQQIIFSNQLLIRVEKMFTKKSLRGLSRQKALLI
ncbi:MAG TPA: DUF3667 domain-containing protein [Puia sp.]|nr:DUF3667 domain-containing protein [Puia sp.]